MKKTSTLESRSLLRRANRTVPDDRAANRRSTNRRPCLERCLAMTILSFVVLLSSSKLLWAASEVQTYSWGDKLKRGAINIVTSPVEVARDIHNTTEEKNLLVGWTVGLLKGLGEGFVRFAAGVIDLFTFPFDFPDSEKAPLIDPEYVWEKSGPKYI